MNNTSVDSYLAEGCGRCDRFQTPECKVHRWTGPLVELREILHETALDEQMKWGQPTYTLDGSNVVMLISTADYCGLSFLQGAALDDGDGLLQKPGPNSRYARLLKFTTLDEVQQARAQIRQFIDAAIEFERSDQVFEPDDDPEPMPAELAERLSSEDDLRVAFEKLTPGRQRSHILYISGAKQATTRERRVQRCVPKIAAGKGYNER